MKDSHNFYVGVSKPWLFVAIQLYWNFKLYCFHFFPNSALPNQGCGLSMDAAYTWKFTVKIYDTEQKYGCTALRLIHCHERCSHKLIHYTNHLTFLSRCIKNHIIPQDLLVQPSVPTIGTHRSLLIITPTGTHVVLKRLSI